MADLAVPHLTRRQTRRLARRLDRRVRAVGPEPIEHRRVRELHGVAGTGRRATEPVEDDERDEVHDTAAPQIAANDATSSDAPPTSAPSIDGWASSSAAFSGLTEPP